MHVRLVFAMIAFYFKSAIVSCGKRYKYFHVDIRLNRFFFFKLTTENRN